MLFIGDSIMDQEGGAATFLLRQAGIDARKVAVWGSGLFTPAQYDDGKTILTAPAHSNGTHWLSLAAKLVDQHRPALVVVAMNHNHPAPYPHDADGHEIRALTTPAGRAMVAAQTNALIDILQRDGARVAFVTPPPEGDDHAPTDNQIWADTLPVLRARNIAVIDIAPAVAGPDGGRIQSAPDCRGDLVAIREPKAVHYTRYGAGLAGTILAQGVAALLHRPLPDATAPGDHTIALVPTATGKGYWLVQCDGSVYHFGDAARLDGVSRAHQPFVAAVMARPRGLWLVARDGTIVATGSAPAVRFGAHSADPIVAATHTDDGNGVVGVTANGDIVSTASPAVLRVPMSNVVAVTPGPVVVDRDGNVLGLPSSRGLRIRSPITAAARVGNAYLLASADGSVASRGGLPAQCSSRAEPLPANVRKVLMPSPLPPVTAIVAAPAGGYWIVRDNGAVIACYNAPNLGGSGNLALFTN